MAACRGPINRLQMLRTRGFAGPTFQRVGANLCARSTGFRTGLVGGILCTPALRTLFSPSVEPEAGAGEGYIIAPSGSSFQNPDGRLYQTRVGEISFQGAQRFENHLAGNTEVIDLADAGWGNYWTGVTILSNTALAPDGSYTATLMRLNERAGDTGLIGRLSTSDGNERAVDLTIESSMWLKCASGFSRTAIVSHGSGAGSASHTLTDEWSQYRLATLQASDPGSTSDRGFTLYGAYAGDDSDLIYLWHPIVMLHTGDRSATTDVPYVPRGTDETVPECGVDGVRYVGDGSPAYLHSTLTNLCPVERTAESLTGDDPAQSYAERVLPDVVGRPNMATTFHDLAEDAYDWLRWDMTLASGAVGLWSYCRVYLRKGWTHTSGAKFVVRYRQSDFPTGVQVQLVLNVDGTVDFVQTPPSNPDWYKYEFEDDPLYDIYHIGIEHQTTSNGVQIMLNYNGNNGMGSVTVPGLMVLEDMSFEQGKTAPYIPGTLAATTQLTQNALFYGESNFDRFRGKVSFIWRANRDMDSIASASATIAFTIMSNSNLDVEEAYMVQYRVLQDNTDQQILLWYQNSIGTTFPLIVSVGTGAVPGDEFDIAFEYSNLTGEVRLTVNGVTAEAENFDHFPDHGADNNVLYISGDHMGDGGVRDLTTCTTTNPNENLAAVCDPGDPNAICFEGFN